MREAMASQRRLGKLTVACLQSPPCSPSPNHPREVAGNLMRHVVLAGAIATGPSALGGSRRARQTGGRPQRWLLCATVSSSGALTLTSAHPSGSQLCNMSSTPLVQPALLPRLLEMAQVRPLLA